MRFIRNLAYTGAVVFALMATAALDTLDASLWVVVIFIILALASAGIGLMLKGQE